MRALWLGLLLVACSAALVAASPVPAATTDAAPSLGTPLPDCGAAGLDYADPHCTTQTRLGSFSVSPQIVHAGGTLTGTIAVTCKRGFPDEKDPCPIDWSQFLPIGTKVAGCGQFAATCTVRVPKDAGTESYTIATVGITNDQGEGISKATYAVIGRGNVGIAGHVLNDHGKPKKRAVVELRGKTTYTAVTDATGYYSVLVPAGKYDVATGKARVKACSGPVSDVFCQLAHGGTADFTYEPKEWVVEGTVKTEKKGKPLPGIDVIFKGNDDTYTVTTDDKGHYKDSIPEDSYRVTPQVGGDFCLAPVTGGKCLSIVVRELDHDLNLDFVVPQGPIRLDLTLAPYATTGTRIKSGFTPPEDGGAVLPGMGLQDRTTGFVCRSACVNVRGYVTDSKTHKPVADAEVTITAPDLTGPAVAPGQDPSGFFCEGTKTFSETCDRPLKLKTDDQGKVDFQYDFPGVIKETPVKFTAEAETEEGSKDGDNFSVTLLPNQIVDRSIVLDSKDVTLLGGAVPALVAASWIEAADPCSWLDEVKGWFNPGVSVGSGAASFSLPLVSWEGSPAVKAFCDSFSSAIKELTVFKPFAQWALVNWFFNRFHINSNGTAIGLDWGSISKLSVKVQPKLSLTSDLTDAVTSYFTSWWNSENGQIKPGQKVRVQVFETSYLTGSSNQPSLGLIFSPSIQGSDAEVILTKAYDQNLFLVPHYRGQF
ncbi:MAG TPA: carboxypeptidase-like regulatory domain-containing protein [Gaiellaceae bacterium]|nr:carboxypeptidase-like regulatory domain-containing protein [Gaiellaceae bacterium]